MYTPWKRGRVLSLPCGGLETLSRVILLRAGNHLFQGSQDSLRGAKIFFRESHNSLWGAYNAEFILERGLAEFSTVRIKKTSHKIYVAASNGLQKNRPNHWQQHWFDGRSINSLWHFIASYCLNAFLFFVWVIISPKHPGFCSNSNPGFFSCPECSKMAAKFPASPTRFLLNPPGGGEGVDFIFIFHFSLFCF